MRNEFYNMKELFPFNFEGRQGGGEKDGALYLI